MQFLNNLYNAVRLGQTTRPWYDGQSVSVPLQFCKEWVVDKHGYDRYNYECWVRVVDGVRCYLPYRLKDLLWYHKAVLKCPHYIGTRILAAGDVVLPYLNKKVVSVALGTTLFIGARSIVNDIRNEKYGNAIGKAVLLVGAVKVATDLI